MSEEMNRDIVEFANNGLGQILPLLNLTNMSDTNKLLHISTELENLRQKVVKLENNDKSVLEMLSALRTTQDEILQKVTQMHTKYFDHTSQDERKENRTYK